MKRFNVLTIILALVIVGLPGYAAAGEGDGGRNHFGPYASGSPDSGTCGNAWA